MVEAFQGQQDEIEQMKECLRILDVATPGTEHAESLEEARSDLEQREGALDILAELCENLDNAAGMEMPSFPLSVCFELKLTPDLVPSE